MSDGYVDLLIKTVLMVAATEPQRRAFIGGYNGDPCPKPQTQAKREAWMLGQIVGAATKAKDRGRG